jgi:hypothetical protein
MPRQLKELKTFTKGTMTAQGKEDLPDEVASFSLDIDNSTEFGVLHGRYEDSAFLANQATGDYFTSISNFITDKPTKDLIFAKIIAGSGLSDDGVTIDTNKPPFTFSIGWVSDWMKGIGSSTSVMQPLKTNGDISSVNSGKACHMGFGGESTVESPKWIGHFGHERFDYAWDTSKPYIEEDWITTNDLITDFDIVVYSNEDASAYNTSAGYDPALAAGTYRDFVTVGKIGGDGLQKWDISNITSGARDPKLVATSRSDYTGLSAATQAWKHYENNLIADKKASGWTDADYDNKLNALDETFNSGWNAGGGGHSTSWVAVTGSLTHDTVGKKGIITPSGGVGQIEFPFTYATTGCVSSYEYTLDIDFEASVAHKIEYRITTAASAGGTVIQDWTTISEVAGLATGNYARGQEIFVPNNNTFYLTIKCTNTGGGNETFKIDSAKMIGVANRVADCKNIDGYWLYHGEYEGSPYPDGRLVRLDKNLNIVYSRAMQNWGVDYKGKTKASHDGDYVSQLMQDGRKVWLNVITKPEKYGFVGAKNREVRIHDRYAMSGYLDFVENQYEQYLHGQIALLFNVDTPDPYDPINDKCRPVNRTPDSTISCTNTDGGFSGIHGAAVGIPEVLQQIHNGTGYDATLSYQYGEYQPYGDRKSREPSNTSQGYEGTGVLFNSLVTNACWYLEGYSDQFFHDTGSVDKTKSVCYKNYRKSMSRIPAAKSGVSWFFSAGGAATGPTGTEFDPDHVKLAGYIVLPRFDGSNHGEKHDVQDITSSLHYLFQIGPEYENLHIKLARGNSPKADQLITNWTSYWDEQNLDDDMSVEGPQLLLDDMGGHAPEYPNLSKILGGSVVDNVSATYKGLKNCWSGQIWPATFMYNPASATGADVGDSSFSSWSDISERKSFKDLAEEIRTQGIGNRCIAAPVSICYKEIPGFKENFNWTGGTNYADPPITDYTQGPQSGGTNPYPNTASYDKLRWFDDIVHDNDDQRLNNTHNTTGTPGQYTAHGVWATRVSTYFKNIGEDNWWDIRRTEHYNEELELDNTSSPKKVSPNDWYEDIVGISQDAYIHRGTYIRKPTTNGAEESGYIDTEVSNDAGNAVSDQWWVGGVQTVILTQKDGRGVFRSLTDLPHLSAGSPFHVVDSNCDGIAGGLGGYSDGANSHILEDRCSCAPEIPEGTNTWTASWPWCTSGNQALASDFDSPIWATFHGMHFSSHGWGAVRPADIPYSGFRDEWDAVNNKFRVAKRERSMIEFDPAGETTDDNQVIGDTMGFTWSNTDNAKAHEMLQEHAGAAMWDHDQKGWQYYHTSYDTSNADGTFDTEEVMDIRTGAFMDKGIAAGTSTKHGTTKDTLFVMTRSDTANKLLVTNNQHRKNKLEDNTTDGVLNRSEASLAPGIRDYLMPGSGTTPNLTDKHWWCQFSLVGTNGLDVVVSASGTNSGGKFFQDKYYYYKTAFLFDGNQETPLSDITYGGAITSDDFRELIIRIKRETIPRRVSHVTIYRSQSSSGDELERDEPFRLVGQIPLTTGPDAENSEHYPGFKEDPDNQGWFKYYQDGNTPYWTDVGIPGSSFESVNGIDETLKDYRVYYGLSTTMNNMHFIGRCWRKELESPETMIMRSKPNRFSTFNWSTDWMKLGTIPTALKSFAGRLYAWDESNMYRIDPNNFIVEDVLEGVGCLSQNSVVVTDFGMMFCDTNNIYLHDGQKAKAIGDSILKASGYDSFTTTNDVLKYRKDDGYQNMVRSAIDNPKWNKARIWCSYIGSMGSFLVGITSKISGEYISYVYAFKPALQRWDKWRIYGDKDEIRQLFLGPDNEAYFSFTNNSGASNTTGIHKLLGMHTSVAGSQIRKDWMWESKKLTMDRSTQKKKLKKVKIVTDVDTNLFDFATTIFTDSNPVSYNENVTMLGDGITGSLASVYMTEQKATSNKDFHNLVIRMSGSGAIKVESLGIIYRTKGVK